MTMPTYQKLRQSGYSLIELLIVMFILAALLTVLIPQINYTRIDAANNTTDYNLAGIDRYVKMYKALNGVYPSGWTTGIEISNLASATNSSISSSYFPMSYDMASLILGSGTLGTAVTQAASADENLVQEITAAGHLGDGDGDQNGLLGSGPTNLTVSEAASLALAGIKTLRDDNISINFTTMTTTAVQAANTAVNAGGAKTAEADLGIRVVRIDTVRGAKTGTSPNGTGTQFTGGSDVTINGTASTAIGQNVVLFLDSYVDWFNYYTDAAYAGNTAAGITYGITASSLVGLADAPKSPLVSKNNRGKYAVVFKTDNSVATNETTATTSQFTPATLLTILDAGNLRNLNP